MALNRHQCESRSAFFLGLGVFSAGWDSWGKGEGAVPSKKTTGSREAVKTVLLLIQRRYSGGRWCGHLQSNSEMVKKNQKQPHFHFSPELFGVFFFSLQVHSMQIMWVWFYLIWASAAKAGLCSEAPEVTGASIHSRQQSGPVRDGKHSRDRCRGGGGQNNWVTSSTSVGDLDTPACLFELQTRWTMRGLILNQTKRLICVFDLVTESGDTSQHRGPCSVVAPTKLLNSGNLIKNSS